MGSSSLTRDGIKLAPPALEVQSLNHWTARKAHILQLQKENVPSGQGFRQRGHYSTHFTLAWCFVFIRSQHGSVNPIGRFQYYLTLTVVRGFPGGSVEKNPPAVQETRV